MDLPILYIRSPVNTFSRTTPGESRGELTDGKKKSSCKALTAECTQKWKLGKEVQHIENTLESNDRHLHAIDDDGPQDDGPQDEGSQDDADDDANVDTDDGADTRVDGGIDDGPHDVAEITGDCCSVQCRNHCFSLVDTNVADKPESEIIMEHKESSLMLCYVMLVLQ